MLTELVSRCQLLKPGLKAELYVGKQVSLFPVEADQLEDEYRHTFAASTLEPSLKWE